MYRQAGNALVTAPTGSGKTVLLDLAILQHYRTNNRNSNGKVVYLGPLKALCSERSRDWKTRLGAEGITVKEITGDSDLSAMRGVEAAHLIVTTPEKFDSMTRSYSDASVRSLLQQVGVLCIDEVHLLAEDRGATLEAVVSRVKKVQQTARFVAISATVPNTSDVASWLGVDDESCLTFGPEYRPVPLETHIRAFPRLNNSNDFQFNRFLASKLPQIVTAHSGGRPSLVFCGTRKESEQAAQVLAKTMTPNPDLVAASESFSDPQLGMLVAKGIGFHHGGMQYQDRSTVEALFCAGRLSVVCTTTTLSQGINLPAHLVVIANTRRYEAGKGSVPLSNITIQQMIGRAGRPQFDQKGVAVVMTDLESEGVYQRSLTGMEPLESTMGQCIGEHINAEVVAGWIQTPADAEKWLRGTFWYTRLLSKSPLTAHEDIKAEIRKALDAISQAGLAAPTGQGDGLMPTEFGRVMSRFYIRLGTMEKIAQLPAGAYMDTLLMCICNACEFESHGMRMAERKTLNSLAAQCKFPLQEKIKRLPQKINILVQASLGNLPIENGGLKAEVPRILRVAIRLAKAVAAAFCVEGSNRFSSGVNAAMLAKCLEHKAWWDTNRPLLQLRGIGPEKAEALATKEILTIADLQRASAREIELACRRNPPFGQEVLKRASAVPSLSLKIRVDNESEGRVTAILLRRGIEGSHVVAARTNASVQLIVGGADDHVYHCDTIKVMAGSTKQVSLRVGASGRCSVFAITRFLGADVQQNVTLNLAPVTDGDGVEVPQPAVRDNPTAATLQMATEDPTQWTLGRIRFDEPQAALATEPRPAEARICKHRCADRRTCGHACCKVGLEEKIAKPPPVTTVPSHPAFVTAQGADTTGPAAHTVPTHMAGDVVPEQKRSNVSTPLQAYASLSVPQPPVDPSQRVTGHFVRRGMKATEGNTTKEPSTALEGRTHVNTTAERLTLVSSGVSGVAPYRPPAIERVPQDQPPAAVPPTQVPPPPVANAGGLDFAIKDPLAFLSVFLK